MTDSHPLVGRGQRSSAICSKFFLPVFMYFEIFNTNEMDSLHPHFPHPQFLWLSTPIYLVQSWAFIKPWCFLILTLASSYLFFYYTEEAKSNAAHVWDMHNITYITHLLVKTVCRFCLRYVSVFGSMYNTLGNMWMLGVSCSLVSIYCYNVQLFSCVLSLLIHNCCRRYLYILLHQVTLKIIYWSNALLSNSRIFITQEDDKLYPVCKQEFIIARARTVWSLLNYLWSMC